MPQALANSCYLVLMLFRVSMRRIFLRLFPGSLHQLLDADGDSFLSTAELSGSTAADDSM